MNKFLKAAIDEAFDIESAGEAAVKKNWTGLLAALIHAGTDAPTLIANLADAKLELESLMKDPTADADLVAYLTGKLSGQPAQIQAVIIASADLLLTSGLKVVTLIEAIKAAKTPVVAAAAQV